MKACEDANCRPVDRERKALGIATFLPRGVLGTTNVTTPTYSTGLQVTEPRR